MAIADITCTISIIYFINLHNRNNKQPIATAISNHVKQSSYTILIAVDITGFLLSSFDLITNIRGIPSSVTVPFHCLKSSFVLILATDNLLFKYGACKTSKNLLTSCNGFHFRYHGNNNDTTTATKSGNYKSTISINNNYSYSCSVDIGCNDLTSAPSSITKPPAATVNNNKSATGNGEFKSINQSQNSSTTSGLKKSNSTHKVKNTHLISNNSTPSISSSTSPKFPFSASPKVPLSTLSTSPKVSINSSPNISFNNSPKFSNSNLPIAAYSSSPNISAYNNSPYNNSSNIVAYNSSPNISATPKSIAKNYPYNIRTSPTVHSTDSDKTILPQCNESIKLTNTPVIKSPSINKSIASKTSNKSGSCKSHNRKNSAIQINNLIQTLSHYNSSPNMSTKKVSATQNNVVRNFSYNIKPSPTVYSIESDKTPLTENIP